MRQHIAGVYSSADIRLFLFRCLENIGDQPAVVLEKFCDTVARPDTMEDCYEPCPGHCVVSQWSPWSQCAEVRQQQPQAIMSHHIFMMKLFSVPGSPGSLGAEWCCELQSRAGQCVLPSQRAGPVWRTRPAGATAPTSPTGPPADPPGSPSVDPGSRPGAGAV